MKDTYLIEIYWGEPLSLMAPNGERHDFSTFEKALYWLRHKWPMQGPERRNALRLLEATMDCLASPSEARNAFAIAARTAGFQIATDPSLTRHRQAA